VHAWAASTIQTLPDIKTAFSPSGNNYSLGEVNIKLNNKYHVKAQFTLFNFAFLNENYCSLFYGGQGQEISLNDRQYIHNSAVYPTFMQKVRQAEILRLGSKYVER
jgi:hypothetical protein